MQIHEITKLKKLEEGLLDTVKAAAKGVGQELAQRHLGAQPKPRATNPADVLKSRGINTFEQMIRYVQANPNIKQQIQQVEQQFLNMPNIKTAIAQASANPSVLRPNPARAPTQPTSSLPATNATMARVAAQNRQMSPAIGIKEASPLNPRAKTRNTAKGQPTTISGQPLGAEKTVASDIDAFTAKKIKGYNAGTTAQYDTGNKLVAARDELATAVNSGNLSNIKMSFVNYMIVAKALTMYAEQKQQEQQAKSQRAQTGDIAGDEDWIDTNNDGQPDTPAPVSSNPQVNKIDQALRAGGVKSLTPQMLNTLKTTGVIK